jgi:transposase
MKKKRTYSSVDVEQIDPVAIARLVLTIGCIVAVDVAKKRFVAAIANAAGEVLRILRFEHPRQTLAFLRVVEELQKAQLAPRVIMEPTGTYGDALRYQCHVRGVRVEMMSPKHTHDIAEVLDGVPSMHDPKAAVALTRLAVLRPGRAWEPDSEERREVRALLDRRWAMWKTHQLYHGHLESMLARYWPELGSLLDVHDQRSWMTLLVRYPGPQLIAASRDDAAATLRKASRGRLRKELIAELVASASTTLGVPMVKGEQERMRFVVEQIYRETYALDALDAELAAHVAKDPMMSRLAVVVGPACAASIISHVGSPLAFENASALEKAMGLNLKVKSSGEHQGNVHITKRGPAQVRQLLYLASLRLVHHDRIVAAWYHARTSYTPKTKHKAVVAVMRKVARALWHVARGSTFDASKLFDVRRLDVKRDDNNTTTPEAASTAADATLSPVSPTTPHEQGGASQLHA